MRLQAPPWAWLALAASLVLFGTLGTWQLNRGLGKQVWLEQFNAGGGPELSLDAGTVAPGVYEVKRGSAGGTYVPDRQLLQDGQSREGRPGFHVWTPLRLEGGGLLLVNRGWIPQPADLGQLPDPAAPQGRVTVSGWWRSLPVPGVRLGDETCAGPKSFPQVVVYPTATQLECALGEPIVNGLLLLDARAEGGFVREWRNPGLPPERHFGYAVTWYALGLTAVFLFFKLNFKQ